MLLALLLYLGDSALFLRSDEAVLLRRGGGRWSARFGLDRWRLAGKEPCLPNPLAPHRPMFKLRWRFDGAAPAPAAPRVAVAVPAVLERFRAHALVSLGCVFVALPATLLYPHGVAYPLAVVAVFYANLAIAMVKLHRHRAVFGLPAGAFAVLAFECAACPPFSINLVRKLCARLGADEDFVAAARRLLEPADFAAAQAQCLRRTDEQIDYAEEGSPRHSHLRAARQRFVAEGGE